MPDDTLAEDGPATTLPVHKVDSSEMDLPDISDLTGTTFGAVTISDRLGAGGMGEVWRAYDEGLDIDVAVKVLQPKLAQTPKYVRRFLREARAVARLDHPNIVRVYYAGRVPFNDSYLRIMVMEFVSGLDAHKARRQSPNKRFSPIRASKVVAQVAQALHYAHGKGVIHRDIKPANILINGEDDNVKVLDFGLAKRIEEETVDDAYRTRAGILLGTPQYMGPEQILRHRADWRADIYSLGITFYELLAGKVPFDGRDHLKVVRAHRDQEITFPPELFDHVPDSLIAVIRGMCQKLPSDRWSLPRIVRELAGFLGEPISLGETRKRVALPSITNISARTSTFLGRSEDVDALLAVCRRRQRGLVSVLGPGGVGKTTIVREVARTLLGLGEEHSDRPTPSTHGDSLHWGEQEIDEREVKIPGGAWFIDLSDAYTLEGIVMAASKALALGIPEENATKALIDALAKRGPTLLVFDNCEQVSADMRRMVNAIEYNAPQVKILLTSREALNVDGEVTFRVAPFDVTSDDGATAALMLFEDRARAARRDFEINDSNRGQVLHIVRALDGIPLAIELAAARVATLSPQKILERLPNRFEILRSRRRDSSQRHAALRSTIEWSWNLLNAWEKLALVQVSVFRGGFFLDAAEAIVDLSPFPDAPMVIDAIEGLVDKNLLVSQPCQSVVGEQRYRLYESVREYAKEALTRIVARLKSSDTTTDLAEVLSRRAIFVDGALHRRFSQFYLEYGEDQVVRHEQGDAEAMARLVLELDNFDAVRAFGVTNDIEVAVRMAILSDVPLAERGPQEFRLPNLQEVWDALDDEHSSFRHALGNLILRVGESLKDVSKFASLLSRVESALKRNGPPPADGQSGEKGQIHH